VAYGTGYTDAATPPYSKFTRTSWIINAVDGMQLYGAVNSKSLTMWKQNGLTRAAPRIWLQNNYPDELNPTVDLQLLEQEPIVPYFANPALRKSSSRSLPKSSCLFRPSWGSPEVFCHSANHGVELKRV